MALSALLIILIALICACVAYDSPEYRRGLDYISCALSITAAAIVIYMIYVGIFQN